jgi:hypothetical protein
VTRTSWGRPMVARTSFAVKDLSGMGVALPSLAADEVLQKFATLYSVE